MTIRTLSVPINRRRDYNSTFEKAFFISSQSHCSQIASYSFSNYNNRLSVNVLHLG